MADNRIQFTFQINDAGKAKVQGLTKDFVSLDNAINKVNTDLKRQASEMNKTGKSTKNMVDKTGLAGATLVELSRTISDSNYGFTAMANNISQLSTLFITLIATTGGLGKGLGALKDAFMGPLGLIVLFNVAVAALERMAMKAKTTKREVDALGGAFTDTAGDLQTFVELIDRGNISNRDLDEALIALRKTYPELNIQIDENRKLTKKSRLEIEEKIKKLRQLAKTQAFQKELEKIYAEEIKLELDTAETIKNIRDEASSNLLTGATLVSAAVRDIDAEEKKGKKARIVVLEKERDDALKILEERKQNILDMATDVGAAAGLVGGKDDPFVLANEIRAKSFKDLGDTIEITAEKMERSDVRRVRSSRESAVSILAASAELTNGLAELFGLQTDAGRAFAVMTATFDTYVAANRVLADPYFIGRPYERFIAQAAIIVTGLANVKNILTSDKNGPNGYSPSTSETRESQAPIFNVVGNSGIDQLGQAIRGTRNQQTIAIVSDREILESQDPRNKTMQGATLSS